MQSGEEAAMAENDRFMSIPAILGSTPGAHNGASPSARSDHEDNPASQRNHGAAPRQTSHSGRPHAGAEGCVAAAALPRRAAAQPDRRVAGSDRGDPGHGNPLPDHALPEGTLRPSRPG